VGAAAPSAADELALVPVPVLGEDGVEDGDALDDEERVAGADSDELLAVDGSAGVLSVEVAGAVVVGEDGVGVVVPPVGRELLASSPRVVVPDDDELLTSADTGFCPISSIPVTIAMATTNTETA
jgi:hypothetical protein